MGSIYPHFEGTRWDRLGYDSYDLDKNVPPVFMDVRKFVVRAGRQRTIVYATSIDGAKAKACEKRGWASETITEVRAIRGANAT